MRRSPFRLLALAVVMLFGAPVATHFVVHDLHLHEADHSGGLVSNDGHGDHEHPVVSSAAPQLPALTTTGLVPIAIGLLPQTWTRAAAMSRNLIAHGALRLDEDVGLDRLLSTFLI